MLLNFRQGLVTYQRDVGGFPTFLQASTTRPGTISIMVTPTPLTVTFAQGGSDYLATFEESVDGAWNTLQDGRDNYLYVDMDMLTSKITFGSTVLVPVVGAGLSAPQVDDQHWFDHSAVKMKVWSQSTQRWMDKIRVFVGKATSSLNIQQFVHGTTVGLNTRSDPGYPMLDTMLRPLRTSTGEFLTTNSNVRIKTTTGTSGVLAQPTNSFISVRAGENIPAMSLVYFTADDTVSLASSDPALAERRTPVGIVKQALVTNEIGTITQYGDITYDQWNWTGQIGKAVYCDEHGAVVTRRPAGLLAYRVGFIKNKNTIVLGIDAETEAQVYQAGPSQFVMNAVTPLSSSEGMNAQGERVITVRIAQSSSTQDGAMSKAQAVALTTATADIANNATLIQGLQTSKANTNHTHTIDQVQGLSTALDGKAPVIHTHTVAQVTGLQAALDGKAPTAHTHTIAQVTGLQGQLDTINNTLVNKADKAHTHVIADVTGLRTELTDHDTRITANATAIAGKADKVHTHAIADVNGLATRLTTVDNSISQLDNRVVIVENTLESKADKVHTHAIIDVTGLQSALDGKATETHVHSIADVTGLQTALDGKAPLSHTHVIADVTDLQKELTKLETDIAEKAISNLADVSLTDILPGQTLTWAGTKWVNSTPSGGGEGPFMTWRGQWNNETIFNEQDMVHYKDGAWVCVGVSPTAVRPGTDESIWTLAAQGGGGGSGALEYWDENAIPSEVAMPNGMHQHIVTFKPSISKFNLAFPDLDAPVQGLDAVIAPYGIGNLSLTNLFTSPGMALNLSLMPNNFVYGPGSVIIGNTGSAIDLPNLTLVDVTSAERLYRIAAWASVIAGGAGTKVESPSSGTFMARRYYLPREEGGDGANLARNVVIGGENSSFRARDSLFMNTTNVSGIDDTIIRTTTIGVDGAEVAAVDSFIANALGSKMNYLVGANIVGTASSDLNGCRGANIFGSKRVNASAQHNFTVIGGNSTHVRDNADKPFYERSSVYENGLSSGQLRRFHIKSMPGQSFEEPNYEFEQTRIGPWIEDRSMYITHYDFDATFAVDGMIDGESTILEIINSSIRAYNLKFSVVYITDPGGQTGKTVVKGLKIIDKLSGENVDDVTSVAAVESREYQGNVFTNVLFNKLHFADGVAGTPRPWTMNLTGQMTELLNFSVPEGILLNDPVPVIPNNPGWEQEVS